MIFGLVAMGAAVWQIILLGLGGHLAVWEQFTWVSCTFVSTGTALIWRHVAKS